MKVIGRTVDRYGTAKGAIIEVSETELAIMTTGYANGNVSNVQTGCALHVHEQFSHSQTIIRRVNEAVKLPGILRALADTLDIAVPQISGLTNATTDD